MYIDNIFIFAAVVASLFFFTKMLEKQLNLSNGKADEKPMKWVARDTLFVYLGVIAGGFVMDQMSPVTTGIIDVFTDDPVL